MTDNRVKTTDYLNHVNVSISVISVKFPSFITPLSPRFNLNLALSKGRMLTRHTRNCASERLSVCWTSSLAQSFWAATSDRGLKPLTVHTRLRAVKAFLRFLIDEEIVGHRVLSRRIAKSVQALNEIVEGIIVEPL